MLAEQLYRQIRNTVRKLAIRDSLRVVWIYSQYLQVPDFKIPADVDVAPQFLEAQPPQTILAEWTLELIAREVIRYSDEESRKGASLLQWKVLAEVANLTKQLENEIYSKIAIPNRIRLELMRISHRQFIWQQHRFGWQSMIRYYKLFKPREISLLASETVGLDVDQIFLIGMAYIGIFLESPRATRNLRIEIPGIDQSHIDKFLAFTSQTRASLSNRLRSEHALDEGFAYRYSSLREFPLVQISHLGIDEILCPIPTLLFWRISSGLYYSLRSLKGFPTAFGKSFQSYVGEVLQHRITNAGMTIHGEVEYYVGNNRKDSIDWIVQHDDDAAMLIECKTMRLTWASKAGLSDLSALDQDVRKLAGAIVQSYKAIRDYRSGKYPHLPYLDGRRIYPVIVTLEDWYLFGFDLPDRLETAVQLALDNASIPASLRYDAPYSIMSVHEFEMVTGVVNKVGVHTFFSDKLRDPELRRWPYGSYCGSEYPADVKGLRGLFQTEFDDMFAFLEVA
jgi:hypothetical protein